MIGAVLLIALLFEFGEDLCKDFFIGINLVADVVDGPIEQLINLCYIDFIIGRQGITQLVNQIDDLVSRMGLVIEDSGVGDTRL